jgi:simple sugar transport system substrate-binding protein
MANPDGLKASMAKAKEAGIPMVAINAGGDSAVAQGALTFVGQDPVVAAKAAGERLVKAGVTKISCVIQVAGNVYLETTCSELAKTPGLKVTNLQVDGTNIADVQATIKSQLLADPSIDGVFTINTDIGKAATEAVAETGSKAKVTAYNLNQDMVGLIKSGKVLFTVDQQGFLQGYQAAQILDENIRYGNVLGGGKPVFTGPSFVTSDNVDEVAGFVSKGTR